MSNMIEGASMEIAIIERGHYDVLRLSGAIKIGETKDQFVNSLKSELIKKPHCLMIDFSDVNYIDSNGIGELVGYLDKFKELDAQLILLGPQSRIRDLLKITRLDQIFSIYMNEEQAVKELKL
jgi:anti-sigma B factor antagonist